MWDLIIHFCKNLKGFFNIKCNHILLMNNVWVPASKDGEVDGELLIILEVFGCDNRC